MFFNVTLPCTLWFFDKDKINTLRKDKILFLDIKNIFRQIDRAHRDLTPEQIEYIASIVKLYRDEEVDFKSFIENSIKEAEENIKSL
jgi:type I restriction enzyme M protein